MGSGEQEQMMNAYSQFASNPEFQKMAENVMQNPNMKGMVDNFMSSMGVTPDPNAPAGSNPMEAMAQAMGSGANMQEMMGQLRAQMGGAMPGMPGMPEPKKEDS